MGKGKVPRHQKNSSRGNDRKSRQIQKKQKRVIQLGDPDEQVDYENLFQMLNNTSDLRKVEKSLISLATISLDEDSPALAQFYDKATISTLLKHAN